MLDKLKQELEGLADSEQAKNLQRFFKTGKGEYGEGDIFLGIKVPKQREIAKKYFGLELKSVKKLVHSRIHEHRLISLLILINKYKSSDKKGKKEIYDFYLANTSGINNWDLVDLSSHRIVGDYLLNNEDEKKILYKLAESKDLWEKRIAIISTFAFIKENKFEDSLNISEILLNDEHDLIHKALGWMLREIGKKNREIEEKFLRVHYRKMPRTMLRYAIEKFPEDIRKKYLRNEI
jgi:3-methyladenine DNA glycosylase AlkD